MVWLWLIILLETSSISWSDLINCLSLLSAGFLSQIRLSSNPYRSGLSVFGFYHFSNSILFYLCLVLYLTFGFRRTLMIILTYCSVVLVCFRKSELHAIENARCYWDENLVVRKAHDAKWCGTELRNSQRAPYNKQWTGWHEVTPTCSPATASLSLGKNPEEANSRSELI